MINKETPEKKLVMNEVDVDDVIDKLENSLVLDITDTFDYLA